MVWIGSDYSVGTDEDLLKEYDALTTEILKRFGKKKLKKNGRV